MKIIECPRDAMQGLKYNISTQVKADYINQLLACNFHTLDFGSFVSPKAIPQMADTLEVYNMLRWEEYNTKLLAIIANTRGAQQLAVLSGITYCGFPLSISETFQQRNTNKSIAESLSQVKEILEICATYNKQAVIYLSMAFGNPYNDLYNTEILYEYLHKMQQLHVPVVSISDTIGVATAEQIKEILTITNAEFSNKIEIGLHLHANRYKAHKVIEAAIINGCRRLDGALLGFGGCPMAKDDLTGNIDTMEIISVCEQQKINTHINLEALQHAKTTAETIFY